ncbi:hypothetical protein [Naasia aerilata]|uniref:Uncharacterized protein n=1 Tax=Naasia aerilata TaxID=1162966 RepID=A0ABM8GE58_9MICO|nr:hypothetical protein [Naasia aerilata]BDZ46583.1 hypothetical protein GCM10025866_24920 [Naasia aerilata]
MPHVPAAAPRHRRRWALRAAAAGLFALILTGVAAPATAATAESRCAGTYFAESGRTPFDIDPALVPPPVRAFPWDCASRIADRDFPAADGWAIYDLVYRDVPFSTVVGVLRSFEDQGWIEGGAVAAVDFTDGQALTAAELERITPEPSSVRARFGNAATGENIVELSYFDGEDYVFDESLTTPTLLLELSVRGAFDATGFGDPSVLSELRRIGDVRLNATSGAVLGGSAVVLMLVVGYPSALLDSVLSPRLDALWLRLRARRRAERSPSTAARSRPWGFAAGLVATAAIVGFVDPAFGPNLLSLRLFLTNLVSLLVFNLAALALLRAILSRVDSSLRPAVAFRWGSLAFVALAVGIARLLDFSPGSSWGSWPASPSPRRSPSPARRWWCCSAPRSR